MRQEERSHSGGLKRWWLPIILVCTLLLGSVSVNVWQYHLRAEEHLQATAIEQAAIAEARQVQREAEARKLKKAKEAKNDTRVQQLYQEINNLSRIHERVMAPPPRSSTRTLPKTDDLEQAGNSP